MTSDIPLPFVGPEPFVLVVGEALVDEVTTDVGTASHPGGSPFNVAIGLARLGVSTLLHTEVGDDERGGLLRAHARESGVGLTAESVSVGSTSYARARIDPTGAAAYDFSVSWRPEPFSLPGTPSLVHVGSIAAVLPPGCDLVAGVVSALKPTSLITFDPNVRPPLISDSDQARRRVAQLVAMADVVKVSDEDMEWLHPGRDIEDAVADWLATGPDVIVVTRGSLGASCYSRWGAHHSVPPETTVADTIGAGDSFAAGLIASLMNSDAVIPENRLAGLDGARTRRAIDFATRCAAITVSRAGAQPPWLAELA